MTDLGPDMTATDPQATTPADTPVEAGDSAAVDPAASAPRPGASAPALGSGAADPGRNVPDPSRTPRAAQGETPTYKGEPLDSERGPGLGCFWIQTITLGVLLIVTPLTVAFAWPPLISAALLIVTLILLLFTGQTVIFLLRLVAADKRGRRTPRAASARKTVGMLEDEAAALPTDDTGTAAATVPLSEPENPAEPGSPTLPAHPVDPRDLP